MQRGQEHTAHCSASGLTRQPRQRGTGGFTDSSQFVETMQSLEVAEKEQKTTSNNKTSGVSTRAQHATDEPA